MINFQKPENKHDEERVSDEYYIEEKDDYYWYWYDYCKRLQEEIEDTDEVCIYYDGD